MAKFIPAGIPVSKRIFDLVLTVLGLASMIAGGLLFVRLPVHEGQGRRRLFLGEASGESQVGIRLYLDTPSFLLYALVLGGLAFLNTWDLPFYLVLFAGAYAVRRWLLPEETAQAPLSRLLVDLISAALALGALSILPYLVPMIIGAFLVKPLVKRFGKKNIVGWPLIGAILIYALMWLLPIKSPYVWIGLQIIAPAFAAASKSCCSCSADSDLRSAGELIVASSSGTRPLG